MGDKIFNLLVGPILYMPLIHCCLLLKVWLSLQETIEDIDKDKDGLIDIEEYVGKLFIFFNSECRNKNGQVDWTTTNSTMGLYKRRD